MTKTQQQTTAMTLHGTVDMGAAREAKQALKDEQAAAKARGDRMKLEEGKNTIRIMPPVRGVKLPFHVTYLHYLRNPADPKALKVLECPLKTRGKPCLVCAKASQLRRTGNVVDKTVASDLSSSRRIFANAVDLSKPDEGVKVAEFGTKIYEALIAHLSGDDEAAVGDFTDPQKGFNIIIEKTVGNAKNPKETTNYQTRPARSPSPIADMNWLTQLHDLTGAAEVLDDAKVQAILEGRFDEESGKFPPDGEVSTADADTVTDSDLYSTKK